MPRVPQCARSCQSCRTPTSIFATRKTTASQPLATFESSSHTHLQLICKRGRTLSGHRLTPCTQPTQTRASSTFFPLFFFALERRMETVMKKSQYGCALPAAAVRRQLQGEHPSGALTTSTRRQAIVVAHSLPARGGRHAIVHQSTDQWGTACTVTMQPSRARAVVIHTLYMQQAQL